MDTHEETTLMMLGPELTEMLLNNLDSATLARVSATCRTIYQCADAVVQHRERMREQLEDDSNPNREEVLERLCELPPVVLADYADTVVHIMLNSDDVQVRLKALKTLSKLDRVVLAQHEEEIKRMLTRDNEIGFGLTWENEFHGIQSTAMRALYKIDPAIVVDIMIRNDGMQAVALHTLSVATLRNLEAPVRERLRRDIRCKLENENYFVRIMAQKILAKIGLPLLPALMRYMREQQQQ